MYEKYLQETLSKKRYEHCIRTMQMAEKLCNIHNVDKCAIIAALLHDIAKELTLDEMISLLDKSDLDEACGLINTNILHGFAGAKLVQKVFNINDNRILSAIKYHTIGKKNMTDIEKVVYISDAIEVGKIYEGVDIIREKTFKSLDKGILCEINYKIKYLIDTNKFIHPNTIELRNEILEENNK